MPTLPYPVVTVAPLEMIMTLLLLLVLPTARKLEIMSDVFVPLKSTELA